MATRRTTTTTRQTKVTSRRATDEDAVDEPEVKQGMSMGDAVVIVTAILLIAAFVVLDYNLGHSYPGRGLFFGG